MPIALSHVVVTIDGMTQITDENRGNHLQEPTAPLERRTGSDVASATSPLAKPGEPPSRPRETNVRSSGDLEHLTGRTRGDLLSAGSANTRKAYASDWAHFSTWCRRTKLSPLPPDPQTIGLYVTACASGTVERGTKANSISTIERRLSSLSWSYAQRGMPLDRKSPHILTAMAGIRNSDARPAVRKEPIVAADFMAMLETLDRGSLRGMRDRAMLMIGYAGGLRRSEIVGLDLAPDQTEDGLGWIEFLGKGILVTVRGKTGWRQVEVGRGSSDATCPIVAIETWVRFAKISHGPLFRRVIGQGKAVGGDRLNDKEVARLVKRTVMAAGIRGELNEVDRALRFSGHSLRAGLASAVDVDEQYSSPVRPPK